MSPCMVRHSLPVSGENFEQAIKNSIPEVLRETPKKKVLYFYVGLMDSQHSPLTGKECLIEPMLWAQ